MKSQIKYSTSCAVSDAVKSLRRYSTITAMRVVGLALFVAGLFIVTRIAASIYNNATESQDQNSLREIKISVGTDSNNFTDECLATLLQKPEIDGISRLYTILPTIQSNGAPIVTTLESASQDWILFEKGRMRVGRGLRNHDEIVLNKGLADRLGINEKNVDDKKENVEITITQERTRAEVKESFERSLKVVGICRGNEEIGYILESDAAKMNAWAAGAIKSLDGRTDIPSNAALAYLKKERFPNLEEYAARNKLNLKEKYPLKIPKLQTSTWAEVDQNRIDPNDNWVCPTYIANYRDEIFVVLNDVDPRLECREIRELPPAETEIVDFSNLPARSTTEFHNDSAGSSYEKKDLLYKTTGTNSNNVKENLGIARLEKPDETLSNTTKVDANVKTYEPKKTISLTGSAKGNVKSLKELKTNEERGFKNDLPCLEEEKKVEDKDEWRKIFVKDDCDVLRTFGFKPESDKTVRIVTRTESEIIILDQKTLASCIKENAAVEKSHIYLEASDKANDVFYRRARCCNAIKTFSEQSIDELVVYEIETTEETTEDTKLNLVNYLRDCDVRFVKEKAEVETTIKGVPIRLLGSQKNDPENKVRLERVEEEEESRGLELSVKDAQALGSLDWKRGDVVELVFTRRLDSGKEQNVALDFRFLGINTETKIPLDEIKNILAWQREELDYDEHEGEFVDPAAIEAARGSYNARVLARSTDDAIKLVSNLKSQGYVITSSGVDKIESTKALFKNLTSFVTIFNSISLGLCLLNIITTDFLVIRLRKNDVAAMIDLGVRREELFKEVFAETVITALLAHASVVLLAVTVGKPLARSLLALTGAAVTDFMLFDPTGVQILIGAGALTLALASIAQISTVVFLARYKRPKFLRR